MVIAQNHPGVNDDHIQTQQELQRSVGLFLAHHPRPQDRPEVMVIIESGGQDRNCLGSFMANSWANVDLESRKLETKKQQYTVTNKETGELEKKYRQVGTNHEISIKAEHLATRSIYEILGTLAHELVHLENHDHDIQDCSKGGAHNNNFKKLAEEWGLTFDIPAYTKDENGQPVRHKNKGWYCTGITDEFKRFVDEEIQPRIELFNVAKLTTPKKPSKSSSVTLQCECPGGNDAPKSITMSIGAMTTRIEQDTEIVCPACDAKFQVR